MEKSIPLDRQVGLFFLVSGELLLHRCFLEKAEVYGDFINYPYSHDEIWEKHYREKYQVDFDFYPRGRIVYNKKDNHNIFYIVINA